MLSSETSQLQVYCSSACVNTCSTVCCSSCPFAKGECNAPSVECVWRKLKAALQKYFELKSFRPGQLDALLPLVHGRDVFVRMAAGAGKSLCLFLAPLAIGNSTIGVVISPLNGLMD